jgi:hypothetical protein
MLEDEQRFEELEAKLAALSSQVEGLELEKEIDPFFEDDVRRLIEDFREKEIVDVEEDEESFDSEDSVEPDFIDVQTTGGRTFKVHWIAPDSCEEMTKTKARAAFAAGAASRYGTSQQVNGGDVLILLCRKPTEEPPASFCHYIGMAVNTGLNPTSLEPDTSGVEAITSAVGNYEIFVWSSCECSVESSDPVTFTSLIPSDNSSESGSYLKLGETGSFSPSSAEVVTDISLDTGDLQAPIDAMSAVALKDSTKTTNQSGFKTKLVNLSESLTENYINHVSKNLTLQGDTQNLIGGNFNTSQYQSKNLELSSTECGGLEAVSISGESYNLNLLGLADDDSGFTGVIKSADISLGVSISSQSAIPSYRATAEDIEHDNNAFIPILSDNDANAIETSDSFSTRDVASVSISSDDETDAPLKDSVITLNKSGSSKSFASGLLKDQTNLADVSISTTAFPVIDRNQVENWTGLGVSGVSLFASSVTDNSDSYQVSLGLNLKYKDIGFETGLLNSVAQSESEISNSVNIEIPKQEIPSITDLVSLGNPGTAGSYIKQLQNLSGSGHYQSGGSIDLQLEFEELRSQLGFNDSGFYTGETSVSSTNSSVSINVPAMSMSTFPSLGQTDLVNVPKIANLRLQSEADGFKLFGRVDTTELSFTKGLFQQSSDSSAAEISLGSIAFPSFPEIPSGISFSQPSIDLASLSIGSPQTDSEGNTNYTLTLTPKNYSSNFEGGLLKSLNVSTGASQEVTFTIPPAPSIYTPDGVDVSLSNIQTVSLSALTPVDNDSGTTHQLVLSPKNLSFESDSGIVKEFLLGSGSSNTVSIFVPKGNDFEGSVSLGNLSVSEQATAGGKTHTISLTPQKIVYDFDGGLVKNLAFSAGTAQQVSFFVPDPATATVSLSSSIQIVQNPAVEVIGQYDSIYSDSATGEVVGDARYYVNYTAKLYDTEFVNGGLKISDTYEPIENTLNGPIIVKGTRIRYGCDPDYGCIIDPAGDYDEPSCGSGCYEYEEERPDPVLTYRPSIIYLYNYYPDSNCYVYLKTYILDGDGANDVSTQYYKDMDGGAAGARYIARYDANDNVEVVFQYDNGTGSYVDLSGTEVVRDLEVAQELLCTSLEGTIIDESMSGDPNDVGFEETISFAPLSAPKSIEITWNDYDIGDVLQVFTQKVNEAEINRVDIEDSQNYPHTETVELEPGTIRFRVKVFSRANSETAWDLTIEAL